MRLKAKFNQLLSWISILCSCPQFAIQFASNILATFNVFIFDCNCHIKYFWIKFGVCASAMTFRRIDTFSCGKLRPSADGKCDFSNSNEYCEVRTRKCFLSGTIDSLHWNWHLTFNISIPSGAFQLTSSLVWMRLNKIYTLVIRTPGHTLYRSWRNCIAYFLFTVAQVPP